MSAHDRSNVRMQPALRALLFAAMLLPLASLQACASPTASAPETPVPSTPPAQPSNPAASFVLEPGASHAVAGAGTLRYERVVNDSRCPPDKQCVWAGDAIVAFAWTPAGGAAASTFELHTGLEPRSHALDGGRRVVLEALARGAAPAATLRIESGG